jgi:acetyl/propionyl-CoA carboxylase alpha subunit
VFKRVLVANRGEIAVRVIRAIHELGAEAVAIYSESDRTALHVRLADYAYPVGPAPAAQSYLNGAAILDVARHSGAEALHPGYGFLSENAAFARACLDAGIAFVGPSPEAMALMGDKVAARKLAASAGVPTVPGTPEPVRDDATALGAAQQIGFPLLIKAAAGGGGKGMRAVRRADELPASLAQARSEAQAAFGDGSVYLEKLVERPRHIEVQLFGDGTGRVEHLGERECSIQRRYQKVVEEAPAPNLPDHVRHAMWQAAVNAASAAKYAGAGTIEFLYEPSSGDFYFLEMNARLQVEHPVTELVTGVDLVHAQLLLAAGASLDDALAGSAEGGALAGTRAEAPNTDRSPSPFRETEPGRKDPLLHAIEARIGAEDPFNDWLPSIGTLGIVREPGGPGIRIDSACEPDQEVQVHYDPLLAKLIAWGRSRDEAIARLRRAVDEYRLTGVRTSLPFHRWLVRDEAFRAGNLSTAFIADRWRPDAQSSAGVEDGRADAAALVAANQLAVRGSSGVAAPSVMGGDGSTRAGRTATTPGASGGASMAGASNWRRAAREAALQ